MKRLSAKNSRRGFSILELLVVIGILGIMLLVALPNFTVYRNTNKMRTSLREFNTQVRLIRQRAITRNLQTKLSFAADTGVYQLYELPPGTGCSGDPCWTEWGNRKQLDESITFQSASTFTDITTNGDSDSRPDIVFLPNGTVGNMPGTTGTVVLRSKNSIPKPQYTVTLWQTGRINSAAN